ncbi:MAG: hypothetical protein JXX28_12955 [Deltaproteobacteria bacterium]|nr:hypothetical protein [Deltaproteobacteria bacterium]
MSSEAPSASDEPGFVRVACPTCGSGDVWLRCDQCGVSDNFSLTGEGVRCGCGAAYQHAVCTCGAQVGVDHLLAVPYDKGPLALAQTEVAWGRVVTLLVVMLSLMGGLAWVALR